MIYDPPCAIFSLTVRVAVIQMVLSCLNEADIPVTAVFDLDFFFFCITTGIQGPRGFDGIGHAGNQGIPGEPGPSGEPGKRGHPGLPGVCDVSMCYQNYNLREQYSKGPNV